MPTSPTTTPADAKQAPRSETTLDESPLETSAKAAPRGGSHVVGAFSMESFCNVGGLSLTHDDAQGFLDWLGSYGIGANFWFRDAGVKVWAYYETYDNWQDTYGLDADLLSYHSGHGGMDSNGVFYAPMGAAWAGNDCTAVSSNMAIGNEYCKYLFWSTCLSLRVLDGQNPLRTWGGVNKGLRMILGFETVSWDDANYGRNFGNRWRAGDSFSSAWLNGSWAIAHDQAPSAAAFGSSAAEAQDRVFNERYFQWGAVDGSWCWWRWYNTAGSAVREPNREIPASPIVARLVPAGRTRHAEIAARFGVDEARSSRAGSGTAFELDGRRLLINDDGSFSARLGEPNRDNRVPLDRHDAESAAGAALRRYNLDASVDLVLDRIAYSNEAGASTRKSAGPEGPFRTATIVQYRQLLDGVPVITPDAGALKVLVDNDGNAIEVTSTLHEVQDVQEQPGIAEPPAPGQAERAAGEEPDIERALAGSFTTLVRSLASKGDLPMGFSIVPGTTEVGYDIQANQARLIVQRAIELDFGQGYRKRFWIRAPLNR